MAQTRKSFLAKKQHLQPNGKLKPIILGQCLFSKRTGQECVIAKLNRPHARYYLIVNVETGKVETWSIDHTVFLFLLTRYEE